MIYLIHFRVPEGQGHQSTSIDKLIDSANAVNVAEATEEQIVEGYQCAETLAVVATEVFGLKLAPETATAFGIETAPGIADMLHCVSVVDAFYRDLEKKNPPTDSRLASMPSTASTLATPQTTNT